MSRHPRCLYDGPHEPHNFVTYVDPPTFQPDPIRALDAARLALEQHYCPGERTPLEREHDAEDDGWRQHPRCLYDGPHEPHNFVTYVDPPTFQPDPIRALDAARLALEQHYCPGERTPLEREHDAEDDGWRQWWAGAGTWTEDQ